MTAHSSRSTRPRPYLSRCVYGIRRFHVRVSHAIAGRNRLQTENEPPHTPEPFIILI